MSIIDIILLAVALAMDCLTVSIVSGLTARDGQATETRWLYRMAFLFGFFQAFMPLLGWLGIIHFETYMEAYDHWIAFGLLAFIGGKMVWESFSDDEDQHFNPRHLHTQLLLAVATSIDALAVGISFAFIGFNTLTSMVYPLVVIGLVSFVFSLVGSGLGIWFGIGIAKKLKPELLGGIILIIIGCKIVIQHLANGL
jgi:putative Mn2+ efflux pump MntP